MKKKVLTDSGRTTLDLDPGKLFFCRLVSLYQVILIHEDYQLGKMSIAKRDKVVKLMHNWQNTGRHKGLFCEAAARTPEDLAMVSLVDKCTIGCGRYESSDHNGKLSMHFLLFIHICYRDT